MAKNKTNRTALYSSNARKVITKQEYGPKPQIQGVKIIKIAKNFVAEDGRFTEIGRLDPSGKLQDLSELSIKQINFGEVLPGTIKAWHLHQKQNEAWFVHPNSRLIVGLLDVRENSPTKDARMRLVLGAGEAHLIYIPKGVAHGLANPYSQPAAMTYLVDEYFDGTDEFRLPFDFAVGSDFWQIQKG